MAAPEYMNDLRKTSQLGFGVYSWFQLVDLVSRHDTSVVYEYIKIAFWYVTLSGKVCQLSSLYSSGDGVYKSQSKITRDER